MRTGGSRRGARPSVWIPCWQRRSWLGFAGRAVGFLEDVDVFGARPFWTLPDGEFDRLPFVEIVESCVLDGGAMKEQLFGIGGDEAKSFVRDELLDGALGHVGPLLD